MGRMEFFYEDFQYDKHGNIHYLRRDGSGSMLYNNDEDDIIFNYTGNQLKNATEYGSLFDSFVEYSNADVEYQYNLNGAMTQDLNKGISNIQYN